ncbi:MAG: ABC transporter permease [Lactobacillus sp.]|nr:ABC transporter permease [Lactobacillus sp.]
MRELALKRLERHLKKAGKYLVLVFNDFFILALIFLFGAILYWYANALKQMPTDLAYYPVILAILLWLPSLIGKLVTLVEEADKYYLSTKNASMQAYLKPLYLYSFPLPSLLIIIMGTLLAPFAIFKLHLTLLSFLLIVASMLAFKGIDLSYQKSMLYSYQADFGLLIKIANLLLIMLEIVINQPLVTLIITVAYLTVVHFLGNGNNSQFNWNRAVLAEEKRQDRTYTLYAMFTDVSEKKIVYKRRKYLDFLLPRKEKNANRFLYRRSLLRNPDYLALWVRMTIFGVLVSLIVPTNYVLLVACVLVQYLTLYQLLPLGRIYDHHLMFLVSPVKKDPKDLISVLSQAIYLQMLILMLMMVVVQSSTLLINLVGLVVIDSLLLRVYLPMKLTKNRR